MGTSAAIWGGAAGGFASGFSGSLLNGGSIGDAFKSGLIGAAVGAATAWASQGIGEFFGADNGTFGKWAGRTLAHGTVGGVASELQGGEFRHGFYSSAAAAGAMHAPGVKGLLGGNKGGGWIAARTATAAAIGGTASVLGGGKFANGATTAAFQHLFNQEATRARGSIVVEKGAYSTDEDVAQAQKQLESLRVSKNPDGSPSVEAQIIAEIEASGKTVKIWPGKLDGEYAANIPADRFNGEGTGGIITYNPAGGRPYAWGPGATVTLASIGIDTLAHELVHARDAAYGTMPRRYPNNEYEPIRVQNAVRARYSVGLRTTHGGNVVPEHSKYVK